jgi:hypothetical protein
MIGPLKTFISQPPEPRKLAFRKGCEMKVLTDQVFTLLKRTSRVKEKQSALSHQRKLTDDTC